MELTRYVLSICLHALPARPRGLSKSFFSSLNLKENQDSEFLLPVRLVKVIAPRAITNLSSHALIASLLKAALSNREIEVRSFSLFDTCALLHRPALDRHCRLLCRPQERLPMHPASAISSSHAAASDTSQHLQEAALLIEYT